MPAQQCRKCHNHKRHRNTSCRLDCCRKHCTCTPFQKTEWRRYVQNRAPLQRRLRCQRCNVRTNHICRNVFINGMHTVILCSLHCPCGGDHGELSETHPARHAACGTVMVLINGVEECLWCELADSITYTGVTNCHICRYLTVISYTRPDMACPHSQYQVRNAERCNDEIAENPRPTLRSADSYDSLHGHFNTFYKNPLNRTIGVEIEVAGFVNPTRKALAYLYNTCAKWGAGIGTDGSLSDPTGRNSSVEIRTMPAKGDTFIEQVRQIVGAIRQANGIVNKSCGLHVHIGFEERLQDVINKLQNSLACLWPTLETPFYKLANKTRQDNTFCRTYGDISVNIEHLVKTGSRYFGLNYTSLMAHKTLEFRIFHGTLHTRQIVNWAMLCAALVSFCMEGAKIYDKTMFDKVTQLPYHDTLRALSILAPTKDVAAFVNYRLRKSA